MEETTIAAIATPPGRGGISIVRISGPMAREVLTALTGIINPSPRHAYFRKFILEGEVLDEGLVLFFPGPHSYTGEDLVEFQGHGGLQPPQRTLGAVLRIPGVRQAGPGEFTKRGFLNGRMDLTAAEAVEDLISSGSDSAARAALASLSGSFANVLQEITGSLTDFRVHLEACLDFPEEHEDFFVSGNAIEELDTLEHRLEEALTVSAQGARLTEGARLVLVGAPNAGKSSLLNALSGTERAIVTAIPGTTRDVLTVDLELEGVPVRITDTAGLRDAPGDEIEAIGIRKALDELRQADLVIMMIDGSRPNPEAPATLGRIRTTFPDVGHLVLAVSKVDLPGDPATGELLGTAPFADLTTVHTSTRKPGGLDELRRTLIQSLGIMPLSGVYSARTRHVNALRECLEHVRSGREQLSGGDLVLCAEELREAQDLIGTITGAITADDLLGKIFSTFCIGK